MSEKKSTNQKPVQTPKLEIPIQKIPGLDKIKGGVPRMENPPPPPKKK